MYPIHSPIDVVARLIARGAEPTEAARFVAKESAHLRGEGPPATPPRLSTVVTNDDDTCSLPELALRLVDRSRGADGNATISLEDAQSRASVMRRGRAVPQPQHTPALTGGPDRQTITRAILSSNHCTYEEAENEAAKLMRLPPEVRSVQLRAMTGGR